MALWRTNGYAKTTVADICRAAGVSRALFYFYFPAKEDVLFEVGLLSTRAAQKTVGDLLKRDYDVVAVISQALRSLERSMARNPRDLIVETILEGYRQEQRVLAGDRPEDSDADMFGELFAKARADGKLARHLTDADVAHGAGVSSDPPGMRAVKAWRATAIRVSRECSRSANALKSRTPRSALARARASSVAASW